MKEAMQIGCVNNMYRVIRTHQRLLKSNVFNKWSKYQKPPSYEDFTFPKENVPFSHIVDPNGKLTPNRGRKDDSDRLPMDKFTDEQFENKSFEIQMNTKPAISKRTTRYTYTAGKTAQPKDGSAYK